MIVEMGCLILGVPVGFLLRRKPAPRAVDPAGGTGFGIHDFKRPDGYSTL